MCATFESNLPHPFLFILSLLYPTTYTSRSSPARLFPERERKKKEYKTPKVSTVHLPPTTPFSHHDPNQEKRAFVKTDNGRKISKQLEEKICRKDSRGLCLYLAISIRKYGYCYTTISFSDTLCQVQVRLGTKSTRKGENGSEKEVVVVGIDECYIYFSNAKKKEKKKREGLVMLRKLVLFFQSFIQDTSVRDDHNVLLHRLLLRVWRFEDFVDFF